MGYNVCKLEPKSKSHQFAGFLDGLPTNNRRGEKVKIPAGVRETTGLLQHIPRSHSSARIRLEWSTASARAHRSMLVAGRGTILCRHLAEGF